MGHAALKENATDNTHTLLKQSVCDVCVMDDSDPDIIFYGERGCNHCLTARKRIETETFSGADGKEKLDQVLTHIKQSAKGRDYDCIIGLSGGVDSTAIAIYAKELGLRPLAVHVDNGWNSDLAVSNIEKTVKTLDIDLYTYVIDWEDIQDLQRSFLRAGVLDIECVSDHAIFAVLYQQAAKHGVKYIISGSNVATESIMPTSWGYDKRDAKHVLALHKRFGKRRLKNYPILRPWKFLYHTFVKNIRFVPLLNYLDFVKPDMMQRMQDQLGWIPYPRKHGESRFTRFFQEYFLPQKFGIDKRKAHFSSMIAAGQMEREEALAEMNKPLYTPEDLRDDKHYLIEKLEFEPDEFDTIMNAAPVSHTDYPNNAWMFDLSNPLVREIRQKAKGETP